jgi:hypothetical protein
MIYYSFIKHQRVKYSKAFKDSIINGTSKQYLKQQQRWIAVIGTVINKEDDIIVEVLFDDENFSRQVNVMNLCVA